MIEMIRFIYIDFNGIKSEKTGYIREGKVGKLNPTNHFKCYCDSEGTILIYENNIVICSKCKKEFKS